MLGHVNRVLAPHGRKLGPDPASTDIATVGGVIANNSGGMRCGVARDSYWTVRSLTFVLAVGDGDRHRGAGRRGALRRAPSPSSPRGWREIRDEIRADAELRERIRRKFEIKNTTGYRLCAFLDADDAAGDLPPPARRLRGDARVHRRGGLRDRAAAAADDGVLAPLPGIDAAVAPVPRAGRRRRHARSS